MHRAGQAAALFSFWRKRFSVDISYFINIISFGLKFLILGLD